MGYFFIKIFFFYNFCGEKVGVFRRNNETKRQRFGKQHWSGPHCQPSRLGQNSPHACDNPSTRHLTRVQRTTETGPGLVLTCTATVAALKLDPGCQRAKKTQGFWPSAAGPKRGPRVSLPTRRMVAETVCGWRRIRVGGSLSSVTSFSKSLVSQNQIYLRDKEKDGFVTWRKVSSSWPVTLREVAFGSRTKKYYLMFLGAMYWDWTTKSLSLDHKNTTCALGITILDLFLKKKIFIIIEIT